MPKKRATRILTAKLDAQVLRIAPVSQGLLIKARNSLLTSLAVSSRIIKSPLFTDKPIYHQVENVTQVIFLGHFFNLGCAIASGHRYNAP